MIHNSVVMEVNYYIFSYSITTAVSHSVSMGFIVLFPFPKEERAEFLV